ncbi:MAG: O-antigen ligase family protein, partial [Rickettsiales bacterium]|nr:O-antigen ligase family protein [Rickettsiales bacterium]
METKGRTPADFKDQLQSGLKLRAEDHHFVPRIRDTPGTIGVALTTIILAYGGLFGFASILVFYALWFSRVKYRGMFMLKPTPDAVHVLIFPLLGCISFLWSSYPSQSVYTSLEYTSSILCAIIIGRLVRTLAFLRGVSLGTAVVLIASIASGRYGIDPFSEKYSLVGLFGSKNLVGMFGEIGIIISLLLLCYRQKRLPRLFYGYAPMAVSITALYLAKSATSVLTLCVVLSMLAAVFLITRLPRTYRGFACGVTIVWFVVLLVTGFTMNWQETVLKSFGKDSTMTGRTVLWEKGIDAGWQKPFLGYGYSAFWVKGNPQAEQLWYRFGIKGRQGFHFHNLFVETFVQLGFVGLFLMVMLLLQNLAKSFSGILRYGLDKEYMYSLAMATM